MRNFQLGFSHEPGRTNFHVQPFFLAQVVGVFVFADDGLPLANVLHHGGQIGVSFGLPAKRLRPVGVVDQSG